MKKTLVLIAALLIISLALVGCDVINGFLAKNIGSTLGEKADDNKTDYENADIQYISNTDTALTVKIKNNTDSTWQSGNMRDFWLEAEKDGEWYKVKQVGEFANTMELMLFVPGQEMTHTFNFADRYGKLTPGKYRVVKSFWANATATAEAGEFHLVCEFTVE